MEDIDMRPGSELFPESSQNYNSYQDVLEDSDVGSPLDSGVRADGVADQKMTDKEMNFRALREEAAKLKQEMSYWKGQAEAFSKSSDRRDNQVQEQQDAFSALDWEEPSDVRKAFDSLRGENERLRHEMRDAMRAIETKASRQDWNSMVTQHVPQLTEKNPLFAEMIEKASNPYEAAYLLAELNSRAGAAVSQKAEQDYSRRVDENSRKPQSVASVGGSSKLSQADYYSQMSDEDFMKMAAKNLASI